MLTTNRMREQASMTVSRKVQAKVQAEVLAQRFPLFAPFGIR
jgi:hypothetical protein